MRGVCADRDWSRRQVLEGALGVGVATIGLSAFTNDDSFSGTKAAADPSLPEGLPVRSYKLFDVTRYGATGNGSTDDAAAIQAAVDSCHDYVVGNNLGGGVVYFPAGTYECSSQLVYYSSQIWMGDSGGDISTLRCLVDLGTKVGFPYFFLEAGNIAPQGCGTVFQDLYITGPGGGSVGHAGNKTTGIRMWGGTRMYRCLVQDWFAGIAIWEDHQSIWDSTSNQNYYNLDYPDSAPGGGNQSFHHVSFNHAYGASVHVGANNPIATTDWTGVHLGACPVGMFHTDGTSGFDRNGNPEYHGTQDAKGMMNDSVLNGVYFEGVGNAAILDISTGSSPTIANCQWNHTGFAWGPHGTALGAMGPYYNSTAGTGYWAAVATSIDDFTVYGGGSPLLPGTIGAWNIASGGVTLIETLPLQSNLFGSGIGGTGSFVSGGTWCPYQGSTARDPSGVYYSAQLCPCSTVVSAGDLVEIAPGSYTKVQRAGGVHPVFGVAMTASATSGNSMTLVQLSGTQTTVNVVNAGAITSGSLLSCSSTTPYHADLASANPRMPVIGVATQPGRGSSLEWVQLRIQSDS